MRTLNHDNEISDLLSYFITRVKAVQCPNREVTNIIAENVLIPLFRKVYGWQYLHNLNIPSIPNFPGIDMADPQAGIAIQVSPGRTQ